LVRGERVITITKNELSWMLARVKETRDRDKEQLSIPDQKYTALLNREYEFTSSLAERLEKVIDSDCKRVAVRW
jgi:plasmid maintenance system antidote protein VapI